MCEEGIDYMITCTYRSQEEQDRLYAQGRTAPGVVVTWAKHSRHTDREAFDIAILKNGKISWRTEDYKRPAEIGEEVGLSAGGHWKTNRDWPHFELRRT
jgi:peptidoglycan L-alanyl-D-glutamate endopeptidase CwlK